MSYYRTQNFRGMGFAPLATAGIQAGISIAQTLLIGPITHLISGCGPSCVVTSQWANQAEALLKKNLQAYLALPSPRTQSVQAAFLQNFDAIWNHLAQQCGQVSGPAGQNCIADRQEGACKWKDAGQCWNWFVGYRDPIANDATVPDALPTPMSGSFDPFFGGGPSVASSPSLMPLLMIGGLVALGASL